MSKPSPFEIISRYTQNRALAERVLFDLTAEGYTINPDANQNLLATKRLEIGDRVWWAAGMGDWEEGTVTGISFHWTVEVLTEFGRKDSGPSEKYHPMKKKEEKEE